MFDSKIIIYIKSWAKKGNKNFGGNFFAPFFSIPFPNFGPILPPISSETAPVLGPTEEFSKKPTYYCSSAMGLGDHEKKCSLEAQFRSPPVFAEKSAVFAQFGPFFSKNGGGIAVFGQNCTFSPETSSFIAELQTYVGFFEKTSVGPRYGGVSDTHFAKKNQIWSKIRGQNGKKGGQKSPLRKIHSLF